MKSLVNPLGYIDLGSKKLFNLSAAIFYEKKSSSVN